MGWQHQVETTGRCGSGTGAAATCSRRPRPSCSRGLWSLKQVCAAWGAARSFLVVMLHEGRAPTTARRMLSLTSNACRHLCALVRCHWQPPGHLRGRQDHQNVEAGRQCIPRDPPHQFPAPQGREAVLKAASSHCGGKTTLYHALHVALSQRNVSCSLRNDSSGPAALLCQSSTEVTISETFLFSETFLSGSNSMNGLSGEVSWLMDGCVLQALPES
jgi:hypothetical protein